jgi:suppressor of ftsI
MAAKLVVLAAVASAAFATGSATSAPRVHPVFANPPAVTSRDGRLDLDLVAAPATYTLGGRRFTGMLYNGAYIPAVWRVRAGDRIAVALHNRLDQDTNLHFHGLDVSPRGHGDNVFLHVHPGQTFNYRITVPQRHAGPFWFHPHLHGLVDRQIIGGLSGAFIVAGSDRIYPLIGKLPERIFLFKHHPIGRADYQELVTVNGMVEPDIPIRPGEPQFWELANIGADRFLKVAVDGMPFYVIGRDGYFVAHPVETKAVLLGPGQRVEAFVVGGRPGRYAFTSVPFKFDVTMPILPSVALGTVVSQGPSADIAAAASRIRAQLAGGLYADIVRSSPIARRRTFTFSRNAQKTKFLINGRTFDENRNDVTVRLGDTEGWTVLNRDTQYHDFHIHQTGFLVTEIDGRPARAVDGYDGLRDTFSVPPMVGGRPGRISIILPFTDPRIVGRFVFHCHVVKHEDKGMMMSIEVAPR